MGLHITQKLYGIVSEFLFMFLFVNFLLEGFTGHDMAPSSMGSNLLPFPGATQTYQSEYIKIQNMLFYNVLF